MQLLTGETNPEFRGGYVAIGNFDGVHRGHRAMIDRLVASAREHHRPALVLTFDPHPLAFLRPAGAPPGLTTIAHRAELLREAGVDAVAVVPTSPELLQWTAEEFFQRIVLDRLRAAGLVEGPNFCFGRDRGGNITRLRQLCDAHGLILDVIEPVTIEGQWVSSSVIRSLLQEGDLNAAVNLLGHPYRLTGQVDRGAERGRMLGFPTANLHRIATVVPGFGVYAGRTAIEETSYPAAVHIGPNPTFGESAPKVEAHLIGFSGDLYGQSLDVDLLRRLRGVQRFDSLDDLRLQLHKDIAAAEAIAR